MIWPHALEIALKRPASEAEVSTLNIQMPGRYAFSADRMRAAAVIAADTVTDALEQAWTQITDDGLLPVDAIWSLYPDHQGLVRLVIEIDDAVGLELRHRAESAGQSLDDVVAELLNEAVARDTATRQARIRETVDQLLKHYEVHEVLRALLGIGTPPR